MPSRQLKIGALASLVVGLLVSSVGVSSASIARDVQEPQLGIDTYFVYNCQSQTLIDQWATNEVDAYKALGANSIGIGFPLYTSTLYSNDVVAELQCNPNGDTSPYMTPPASVLAPIVEIAHAAGLKVLLRPLLDQQNLWAQNPHWWRGKLWPADPSLWIENYLTTLRPYLLMAQSTHVEYFAIQTELDSLTGKRFWGPAISLAQALYHGQITFAYAWEDQQGRIKDPPDGATLGFDPYPKLTLPSTATVREILAQWNLDLDKEPSYHLPEVAGTVIDETGITAQDGSYANPETAGLPLSTNPFNQQIQVHWYEAACKFAQQHEIAGLYFWGPWLTSFNGDLLTAPDPSAPNDIQPKGQAAIQACFTSPGWS